MYTYFFNIDVSNNRKNRKFKLFFYVSFIYVIIYLFVSKFSNIVVNVIIKKIK